VNVPNQRGDSARGLQKLFLCAHKFQSVDDLEQWADGAVLEWVCECNGKVRSYL
jgi:hypothetical protein